MNHLEVAQIESQASEADVVWEAWCARVETLLGGSIDGEGRPSEADYNGYSLDEALDRFEEGWSPDRYYAEVSQRPCFNVRPRIGGDA